MVLLVKATVSEDAVPAVVNVSLTVNTSVVSRLLVKDLVTIGMVALVRIGAVAIVGIAAVVNIVTDGVRNVSVVIIDVLSFGKLLLVSSDVAVNVSSVLALVSMVTSCTETG